MSKSVQPETDIRNEIKVYLELLGWGVKRIQQFSNRKYRAESGLSDLLAMKNGLTIYIEVKTKTGVQSNGQKDFQELCIHHDCKYFLVRSIEDMEFKLAEEGLL